MRVSRIRSIVALVAAALVLGVFTLSPVAAHFTTNTKHLGKHAWQQFIKQKVFTKTQANRRFATKRAETYREIGAAGEPAFQNGWANFGGAFSHAGFYKDSEGLVHLKGTLSGPGNGSTAFTLPAGYRPPEALFLPMAGGGPIAGNLIIGADGQVQPTCAGGACAAGIDGLIFRAAGPGVLPGAAAAGSGSSAGPNSS